MPREFAKRLLALHIAVGWHDGAVVPHLLHDLQKSETHRAKGTIPPTRRPRTLVSHALKLIVEWFPTWSMHLLCLAMREDALLQKGIAA